MAGLRRATRTPKGPTITTTHLRTAASGAGVRGAVRRALATGCAALAGAAMLTGCGQNATSAPNTSASPTPETTSTARPSSLASSASPTPSRTSPTATPTATPRPSPAADVTVDVAVRDGRVSPNAENVQVKKGQSVQVRLTSDVAESIHVHGYDKSAEASDGKPGSVTFTADVSGVFEIETHETEKLVAKLIVS